VEGEGEVEGEAKAAGESGEAGELDTSTRQVIVDAITTVSEKLVREISLCFRYYTVTFRGKRVERAVLSGGEAYEQILVNVLKRQLAVDVEMSQPFRGFDMMNFNVKGDRRSCLAEWTVAVGLSLKGWKESGKSEPRRVLSPVTSGEAEGYERN
jgi:type IV pilus assembly protein PilM